MATRCIHLLVVSLLLAACGGGGSSSPAPNQAPQLDVIGDVAVDANAQANVSVSLADDQTAADDLALTITSDNAQLFPVGSIDVSDRGRTRNITLTPEPDSIGTANVTVTVSDANGAAASTAFGVRVNALQLTAAAFARDLATQEAEADPVLINAVSFTDLGDEEDFVELLQ